MKIATALELRKSLLEKGDAFLRKARETAYEKDGPKDDPNREVSEYLKCMEEFERLSRAIKYTNSVVIVGGLSLENMRTRRDLLKQIVSKLSSLPHNSSTRITDYENNKTIKVPAILDIDKVRSVENQYSKEARELDELLQSTNWTQELIYPE